MTDPREYGKVGVLMGGWAGERPVSLKSGNAVLKALLDSGVDAIGVDVTRSSIKQLDELKLDRAFIIIHGKGGEDGVMQGYLEALEIPYTGCGVLASAIGMDKWRTKGLWQAGGLQSPASIEANSEAELAAAAEKLGYPLMVKPAQEGSSIGISKVNDADDIASAWKAASEGAGQVFAEQFVQGDEYTVAILNDQALPAIRLETPHEFYDFDAKYQSNSTQYHCPCGLDAEQEAQMQALALKAASTVGVYGWCRVDMMRDQQGNNWLIEINTVPGMTGHSLVPMAAKQHGLSFEQLVLAILDTSVERGDA